MPELNRSLNQQRNVSTSSLPVASPQNVTLEKKKKRKRKLKRKKKACLSRDVLIADTMSSVKTMKTNMLVSFYGGPKVLKTPE